MTKQNQLIELYCAVCYHYDSTLAGEVQRFSNNFRPKFTDEECLTIYLFGIAEGKFEVKAVYNFIKDYWHEWFPKLPSYQKFNKRINNLACAFIRLAELFVNSKCANPFGMSVTSHIIDSMPIVVASSKRSGSAKAASGLCDKGYCSSKNMYYYGLKLHILGEKQYKTLPSPRIMEITKASTSDLTHAKSMLSQVRDIEIFADKIYLDAKWHKELQESGVTIMIPVKLAKAQQLLNSADKLLSAAVARARQAIESFNNWIHQKTNIQSASKVRSDNGLIAFVFARIAALVWFNW